MGGGLPKVVLLGAIPVLGLVTGMPFVFVEFLDLNEEYQVALAHLTFDEQITIAVAGMVLLAWSVAALWFVRNKLSFWPAIYLLGAMIVPDLTIAPRLYKGDEWDLIELNTVMVGCFVMLVWLSGLVEGTVVRRLGDSSPTPPAPDRSILDFSLIPLIAVGLVVVVGAVGLNVDLQRGLEDVYSAREYLRDFQLGFVGYVSNWLIVVAPSAIYGILSGSPLQLIAAAACSLGLETVMLMATSARAGLWLALLPLFYFLLRKFDFQTRVVLYLAGLLAVTVGLPFLGAVTGDFESVLLTVPRRAFYVPGILHGLAFDIFSTLPPLEFVDLISRFTGEVVQFRYTFLLGLSVGIGEGANANVSFMADAYVNARYLGMILVSGVVGITIGVMAGLAGASRSTTGVLFLIALAQQYAETAFQQVYLTSGLVVVAGLLVIRLITTRRSQPVGRWSAQPLQ